MPMSRRSMGCKCCPGKTYLCPATVSGTTYQRVSIPNSWVPAFGTAFARAALDITWPSLGLETYNLAVNCRSCSAALTHSCILDPAFGDPCHWSIGYHLICGTPTQLEPNAAAALTATLANNISVGGRELLATLIYRVTRQTLDLSIPTDFTMEYTYNVTRALAGDPWDLSQSYTMNYVATTYTTPSWPCGSPPTTIGLSFMPA